MILRFPRSSLMNVFLHFVLLLTVTFIFSGCASHPTICHKTLEKGETYYGYTLSYENVFPVFFYRYGITNLSDVGFRLGVPVYGSGIDYSRLLYEKENRRDILNLGWSLTPNSNFDVTYFKFKTREKPKNITTYWGLRGMFIPKGINGSQSTRVGILLGAYINNKFGYEIGYYHDLASMPITQLFNPNFDSADTSQWWGNRYIDFPHISDFGLPTEHSRLVGLSFRVTFLLGTTGEGRKKSLPKNAEPSPVINEIEE